MTWGCLLEWWKMNKKGTLLFTVGCAYIALAFASLITLFRQDPLQPYLILWLLCLVWATDSGAYLIGKWLQGPLLAPRISPAKTWAGFWGGMICGSSVAAGFAFVVCLVDVYTARIYGWGVVLVLVAQLGDLLESACKRYLGVKDSGNLIPGHGGGLDRVDSLMAASMALVVILRVRGYF